MRHLHHATGELQRTATRCNILHHPVTYCNTLWQPMRQFHHATGELQHAAICCNMPQHTATRLATHAASLPCTRYTATHCVTLQHTAPPCNVLHHAVATRVASCKMLVLQCNALQHTATHCNALQHTATHYNFSDFCPLVPSSLRCTAPHYNTLHHTAPHCNTLQHTATHCNTLHDTNTFFISTSDLYSGLFFSLGFMEVPFVVLF